MTAMTTALSANLSHLELERELPETVSLTKCCESPLLSRLLSTSVIHSEDWDKLSREKVQELVCVKEDARLLKELESQGLLTRFQSARLRNGLWHGLILGNYRILDQIGAGGMGVVYRAEHVRLRRQVAIKVLAVRGQHQRALLRFSAEMRAVAKMNHPNVVCAIDAGKVEADELGGAELHYYVMEHIPGRDLEKLVDSDGPLPVARACGFMLQVANALIEADKLGLVHRDIKPSNVLITPEGEAKLLDFGLVHHFHSRLTDPNTTLGTIDYMAPEQAIDASTVDTRADVYGLGATLYWCLTGRPPFGEVNLLDMAQRITQEPPSARLCRPEIPRELDSVLLRLLAPRPMDRYQTPAAVARAIAPFCASVPTSSVLRPQTTSQAQALMSQRVLIVDDDAGIRRMCRAALETDDFACEEAENGAQCFEKMESQQFDLILLDIDMPSMDGKQVLEQLRRQPPSEHLKVIMMSGQSNAAEMARMLLGGADDYLKKPFTVIEFTNRVKAALRLRKAEQRSDLLQRQLLTINAELEEHLSHRSSDLLHARNAFVQALTRAIELRGCASANRLRRMPAYCRCLAEAAAQLPSLAGEIDRHFIEALEFCAPLHDLGNIGLPDSILFSGQPFDQESRLIMQSHTALGASMLREVAKQQGYALAFLSMAIDVARHHHERFDGTGYPDHLEGTSIPLAARMVALADAYDSLRHRQKGRPPLEHGDAIKVLEESTGQFDPSLLQALNACAARFEQIATSLPG